MSAPMETARPAVESHYAQGGLLEDILRALREMGKDPDHLEPADLAPVDEFHIRGREATIELARRASIQPGERVLDVGCGLGGSVRYLAAEHGCRAVGIDLTRDYVEVAQALADRVGLANSVEFRQASATDLPFPDGSFDVVWTEHVQMNIADKRSFYSGIARVLRPGGRLAFHDVFQGPGGEVHFPVPWALDASINFLGDPEAVRKILEDLGFSILDWEDKSRHSLEWFAAVQEKLQRSGPLPLGLHLLMGSTSKFKIKNVVRNLREARLLVFQAVARSG